MENRKPQPAGNAFHIEQGHCRMLFAYDAARLRMEILEQVVIVLTAVSVIVELIPFNFLYVVWRNSCRKHK